MFARSPRRMGHASRVLRAAFPLLLILPGLLPAAAGGKLRVGLPGPVYTLDSQKAATDPSSLAAIVNLKEGLFELQVDGSVQPLLAEEWTYRSAVGRLEIRLREGVRFHNQDLLTVEDAVFTFRRLLDPELDHPTREHFRWISDARSSGGRLVLEIAEPVREAQLLELLSRPELLILSRRAVREEGEAYGRSSAVGTGPFRLVEWVRGEKLVLGRNESYWQGDSESAGETASVESRRIPPLDRVELVPYSDVADLIRAFRRGAVRLVVEPPPEAGAAELRKLRRREAPGRRLVQVYLNLEQEPWKDERVRRAVSLGVDRAALVREVYAGLASVAPGPVPADHPAHDPGLTVTPHDPDRARELLAEAGYGPDHPLEFPLLVTDQPGLRRIAGQLAQDLARLDVTAMVHPVPKQRLFDLVYGRLQDEETSYSAALEDWRDFGEPTDAIQFLHYFHSSSPANKCRYRSDQVDALLDSYARVTQPSLRREMARSLELRLARDLPSIFLVFPRRIWLTSRRLVSFAVNPRGEVRLRRVELRR